MCVIQTLTVDPTMGAISFTKLIVDALRSVVQPSEIEKKASILNCDENQNHFHCSPSNLGPCSYGHVLPFQQAPVSGS